MSISIPLENFLKETVSGVIILGAVGSLFAVGILWLLRKFASSVLPLPLIFHRKVTTKQAFLMGYSHRMIVNDKSNGMLITALMFHICLLVIYLFGFMLFSLIFSVIIVLRSNTILTWGSFITSASALTLTYLAYLEFEYIYRTYLTWWKRSLEETEKAYSEFKQSRPNK